MRQRGSLFTAHWPVWALVPLLLSPAVGLGGEASGAPVAASAEDVIFARVGGESVSDAEFQRYVHRSARRRFYHGRPSETEVREFEAQLIQGFTDRVLLRQEAQRRGITVDASAVSERLSKHDGSVGSGGKDVLESDVRSDLLIEALEGQVRRVPPVSTEAARDYFQRHPEKFTVPERVRVAVILLKVPPYAPAAQWQARLEEAKSLRLRVLNGEDFAALAREYSEHETANRGGDLGLVHSGMLARELQGIVDKLPVGDLAEPAAILQGIVLVRLDERQPPVLTPFERASDRAQRLLEEEQGEKAWQLLLRDLREKTPVTKVSGAS